MATNVLHGPTILPQQRALPQDQALENKPHHLSLRRLLLRPLQLKQTKYVPALPQNSHKPLS